MNKIEGGPACDRCLTTGKVPGHNYLTEPCPDCEGTGIAPLSEWTDAQKAEWLREWLLKYLRIEIDLAKGDEEPGWYWQVKNLHSGTVLARDRDFSAALTAAVVAVAKERDEQTL